MLRCCGAPEIAQTYYKRELTVVSQGRRNQEIPFKDHSHIPEEAQLLYSLGTLKWRYLTSDHLSLDEN